MKIKVGVMGSAGEVGNDQVLLKQASNLAAAIAKRDLILLTGATTGIVYLIGKAAHDHGAFHIGISPGSSHAEHTDRYRLPTDACDAVIYTGFGLKGRNVVLVRSCDVVLFVSGAMGSLNEFTIAHDEGKIIGCLSNTGGVADEANYLLAKFSHHTKAQVFQEADPELLLEKCLKACES
ncbi:MAG TPA: hypothetical protein VIB00_12430 [Pyrinomonadaceae bacterium]|jgi:uncharacterized protein (TIGR00725 family)